MITTIKIIKNTTKIFIFVLMLTLTGCLSLEVRKQNLTSPKFETEKVYFLQQMMVEVLTTYDVWKEHPVDLSEYDTIEQMNEAKLFYAEEIPSLNTRSFRINDNLNKIQYTLFIDHLDTTRDSYTLTLKQKDYTIAVMKQFYDDDIFVYSLTVNSNKYEITGELKKFGEITQSFLFNIKNGPDIFGYIFKKYGYFINEYEIIINKKFKEIPDGVFISLAVGIDQILKEKGFQYK
jgi:hypothetical protein